MRSRISAAGTTWSRRPGAVGVERHELDEAHAHALGSPEGGEVDDLVVVHAPHHHAVDLHRVEPGVERGVDAGEHLVEVVAPGEARRTVGPQRVERDVDPPQAGGGEIVRPSRGSLTPLVVMREVDAERRQHLDEHAGGGPARWARRR